MTKTVLITGGAGFIGSNIADRLISEGNRVLIVDNLSCGQRSFVPEGASLYEYDITGPQLESVFRDHTIDTVYHFAAQKNLRTSLEDPVVDAQANVVGSLAVFDLCKKYDVTSVVYASSGGAIYGEATEPQSEDHPERPVSPYGVSKLCAEKYLQMYAEQFGLNATSIRFSNVYGPKQDPNGEAGVVAIFIEELLNGRSPYIYGTGKETRDFVYVGDVVDACIQASTLTGYNCLNIATATETSILDLFSQIKTSGSFEADFTPKPDMLGGQLRSVLTNDRAQKVLNWSPQTSIQEGIQQTIAWFRETHSH